MAAGQLSGEAAECHVPLQRPPTVHPPLTAAAPPPRACVQEWRLALLLRRPAQAVGQLRVRPALAMQGVGPRQLPAAQVPVSCAGGLGGGDDQRRCAAPWPARRPPSPRLCRPPCSFPHPPFKIPEHLPKPADPIANPPAAAAKQKAAAQAAAAALAAEQSGPKEMAIVTWLGHWQCDCGKVHKLWDSCKCGQAPPCRCATRVWAGLGWGAQPAARREGGAAWCAAAAA